MQSKEPIKLWCPNSHRVALAEILCFVPDGQAKQLLEASLRGALPSSADLYELWGVVQCVSRERAGSLVSAYLRGEPISERLLDRPDMLLYREWTRAMCKKFLPDPVAVRDKVACWLLSCIEEIERTEKWKAARAKAAARQARREQRSAA